MLIPYNGCVVELGELVVIKTGDIQSCYIHSVRV